MVSGELTEPARCIVADQCSHMYQNGRHVHILILLDSVRLRWADFDNAIFATSHPYLLPRPFGLRALRIGQHCAARTVAEAPHQFGHQKDTTGKGYPDTTRLATTLRSRTFTLGPSKPTENGAHRLGKAAAPISGHAALSRLPPPDTPAMPAQVPLQHRHTQWQMDSDGFDLCHTTSTAARSLGKVIQCTIR
jgi:hypothetical protein